jgi:hypothetical protein
MRKLLTSLLLLLCFAVTSCSKLQSAPDKPPVEFNPSYLNQQIKLIAYKQLNPFKTDVPVSLHLEYDTTNKIVFPPNYNLKIFIRQNGRWDMIQENPSTRSTSPVILSPDTYLSYQQIVTFSPDLGDLTKTYFMRAYVFGDMTTTEGNKQVAAFSDFLLSP